MYPPIPSVYPHMGPRPHTLYRYPPSTGELSTGSPSTHPLFHPWLPEPTRKNFPPYTQGQGRGPAIWAPGL